jgi:hypothetical protein
MATEFFIRGNVPSLKNNKIATKGRAIVSNPTIARWQKLSLDDWVKHKAAFKLLAGSKCPLFIHLTFIRERDNTWDFTAPTETIADEMVKHNWLNDDNIYEFVPCFGKPRIDRMNPGVIIRILKSPPQYEFL